MQTLRLFKNQQLTHSNKYFSGSLWGPLHERAVVDRVVSTPTWPIPYYQRLYKAYPVRGFLIKTEQFIKEPKINKSFLSLGGNCFDDTHWYYAKKFLNRTLKGRQSVQYVEQNLDLKSYLVIQNDVSRMTKAYVSDISLFLNCANKENKVILDSQDLI